FWKPSRRKFELDSITLNHARPVAVFVDEKPEQVLATANRFGIQCLQFHGKESPEYCREFKDKGFEIIKMVRMGNQVDWNELQPYLPYVNYFLFDTAGKLPGGNGSIFNWELLKDYPFKVPYILSGGLGVENVEEIIAFANTEEYCAMLDFNSKLEDKPGIKNLSKVKQVLKKLREIHVDN
ncbi:MAG: phosphoribosylanthranilate isomerase, partial [Luteibaculum sp.]